MKNHSKFWLLLTFSIALSGCGDDSDETPAEVDSGAGDGDGDGDAAAAPSGMVQCGSAVCVDPFAGLLSQFGGLAGSGGMTDALAGLIPAPCCFDEAEGTCGTMSGSECIEAVEGHPDCADTSVMLLGMFPSCCTPSGQCGQVYPAFLAGFSETAGPGDCVENTEADAMVQEALAGFSGMAGVPAGGDDDGGVEGDAAAAPAPAGLDIGAFINIPGASSCTPLEE